VQLTANLLTCNLAAADQYAASLTELRLGIQPQFPASVHLRDSNRVSGWIAEAMPGAGGGGGAGITLALKRRTPAESPVRQYHSIHISL